MLPAAGLQSALADEPAARPATTGGDAALEGFEGGGAATSVGASAATHRDDGTLAADGLVYAATDDGLTLVGFDGPPEGEDAVKDITVPASISIDGKDASVVAVDIAEGQVADSVVSLTLPQSVNNVNTATLAAAFPNLASIEIAAPKASAPVAAGAAAIRGAYSSFGGVLYKNAWVATDGDASQTTLTKELVWVPPTTVVARIPAECTSIAPGAFAEVKDLKTVVCFGVMGEIPQAKKATDGTVTPGAFTDEQIQTVNVIVPQTGTVVPNGDHVSASVAVTDDSTMDVKREAWWKSGFASDRITLGEVYGSTTNALPVNDEGVLETAEAEVAYAPETTQNSSSRKAGIEPPESAIPTPVPDDDELDPSESGLVFTHLADMTLSVSWKGDPTATPSHIDIPAYATINGVTYPVTEIAPEAFKGAVFLTSVAIPETVKTIGDSAFDGCTNLDEPELPSALRTTSVTSVEASTLWASSEESGTNYPTSPQALSSTNSEHEGLIESYADASYKWFVFSYDTRRGTMVSPADAEDYFVRDRTCGSYRWMTYRIPAAFDMTFDDSGLEACVDVQFWSNGTVSGVWRFQPKANPGWTYVGAYHDYGSGNLWDGLDGSGTRPLAGEITHIRMFFEPNIDLRLGSYFPTPTTAAPNPTTVTQLLGGKGTTSSYFGTNDAANGDTVAARIKAVDAKLGTTTNVDTALADKKDASDFGAIKYDGDGGTKPAGDSSGNAYPTTYRKGGSPVLPTPVREGYEFQGWTWSRSDGASSDDASMTPVAAFAEAGTVTLTAKWGTPEANYFFTEKDSYKGGEDWNTVAVRLSTDEPAQKQVSVTFSRKDGAPFVSDGAGIQFKVGSKDSIETGGTWIDWDSQANATVVQLDGGGWGLYVKVHVPDGAVAPSTVSSYVDSSYVASFATMRYTFAS